MGTKRVETFADAPPGFAYLRLSNGKLRFRTQEVLRGVNWDVQTGQRVGLVGNNGAGKTTQLRVLAEELELDEGARRPAKTREDTRANRSGLWRAGGGGVEPGGLTT